MGPQASRNETLSGLLGRVHRTDNFDIGQRLAYCVHQEGSGAYGTFTVTHDITQYTKAKNFSDVGKQTDLFVRFSTVAGENGPRFFAQLGQRLVDMSHITPGAHVLDVATGRGAVLFAAAAQVGSDGRAVGIDLAENMVRETMAEIQRTGRQNVEMHQMSAEQLDFPDASFDSVLCGFALWFFPQPHHTLQEFFRVLKPGGRVGLTTWADDCPFLV